MEAAPTPFADAGGAPALRAALLGWYARGHRAMPWRETRDPYRIWLAESMLQQTTVTAVIPYYQRFLARFPDLATLAAADIADVLGLWQGLGYYRRAHLLLACARTVRETYGGQFPNDEDTLLTLPGFGPYTAAVVAACAFDRPTNVVDGNVERVVARLFRHAEPLPRAKSTLRTLAARLIEGMTAAEARAYANAIMELGSQICVPKAPTCLVCPVSDFCAAQAVGDMTTYPRKSAKKVKPTKRGVAWVVRDARGRIWLRQRPAQGLLGGLWETPHSGWENAYTPPALVAAEDCGVVVHVFTHFRLELDVRAVVATNEDVDWGDGAWFARDKLPPLATLMRKVVAAAGV
jgi:A/G-specific adenine glycosylase